MLAFPSRDLVRTSATRHRDTRLVYRGAEQDIGGPTWFRIGALLPRLSDPFRSEILIAHGVGLARGRAGGLINFGHSLTGRSGGSDRS